MTREEALKILDTIPTKGDEVDALEMAISALEQSVDVPTDTISRQAAIDMFNRLADDPWNANAYTTWSKAYGYAAEMIEEMPSARRKGRWIRNNDSDHAWKCSVCGCGYTDYRLNYCYDCGAEMKGEEDETD